MTTVELEQQRLLIGGEWVEASGGGTLRAHRPVRPATRSTLAAAAGREDARARRRRRGRGVPGVVRHARRASAATLLSAAADMLMEARARHRRRR